MNFKSTYDFYRSKEWADCKAQVLDRELKKGKGVVYCAHCHKPITKGFNPNEKNNRYAMVFHHVIYLTNQNVNDYSISLNPDNIQILHWHCHNEIHERFGFGNGGIEKKVYIVTGSPCSGKSSFVRERAERNDLILDIDDIWQAVSGQPRYEKPDSLKPIVFTIRDEMKELIGRGVGSWRNAFVIASLPSPVDRAREADRYRAFNVEVVTMEASEGECLDRLNRDPNGRDIKAYAKYIHEYYKKYIP